MRKFLLILVLVIFASKFANCQSYVSDSIIYLYNGNVSKEREQQFLKQFGLKDTVTDKIDISREGDNIFVTTKLKQEKRYRVMSIVIENSSGVQKHELENNVSYTEEPIIGWATLYTYYEEIDYYDQQHTSGSSYVTVFWREFDLDGDEVIDRLMFKMINSNDIIEIIYCHVK